MAFEKKFEIDSPNAYSQLIKNLQKNENYLDYIKNYPGIIATLNQENKTTAIAYHFSVLAECLYQIREIQTLDTLLPTIRAFALRYNPAIVQDLDVLELTMEKNKSNYAFVLHEIENKKSTTTLQLLKADILLRMNKINSAKSIFLELLPLADPIQQAEIYNGLGSNYYMDANLDSATYFYQKALLLCAANFGKNHSRYAQVIYNLGLVYGDKNDLYNSEKNFRTALAIYEKKLPPFHPRLAEAYSTLGGLYMNKDDLESALYYYKKDKTITEYNFGKAHAEAFYAYLNCGTVYTLKGEIADAERELKTAYAISHEKFKEAHYQKSLAALELSKVYKLQKKYSDALHYLNEALQIDLQLHEESIQLIDIYYELGENNRLLKNFSQSNFYFLKSLDCSTKIYGSNNDYWIDAYNGLAKIALAQNQIKEAYAWNEKAENVCKDEQGKVTNEFDYWECRLIHFQINQEKYKTEMPSLETLKRDLKEIKNTIGIANKIKNTYYTQESKLYYNEKIDALHKSALYLLNHFYTPKDDFFYTTLWYFIQRDKANLLRSSLQDFDSEKSIPKSFQRQLNDIKQQLNYFVLQDEQDSVFVYQKKYNEILLHLEKQYPKYFALRYDDKILPPKAVQNFLQPLQAYISYYSDNENYYALTIDNLGIVNYRIASISTVDSLVKRLNTSINLQKVVDDEAQQLYSLLFSSHAPLNELIIEPCGTLSVLPFDVLHLKSKPYLFENHTTIFSYSANTFFHSYTNTNSTNCLAIFPSFHDNQLSSLNYDLEKESLKALASVSFFTQDYACKKAVITQFDNFGLLHFGTHLLQDTIHPMQSKLMLSNNEYLTLDEIWKLQTHAQFVCLAACKSNEGKQLAGEGLQNFAWAFEYAGASNVMTTRWNAADKATAEILASFYAALKRGDSKTKALQYAKQEYLKHADAVGVRPFYWANFALYGNMEEINIRQSFFVSYWWIPVLCLILLLIGMRVIYKWRQE